MSCYAFYCKYTEKVTAHGSFQLGWVLWDTKEFNLLPTGDVLRARLASTGREHTAGALVAVLGLATGPGTPASFAVAEALR